METWRADHERRCDDRQTAMGREVRDMKLAVNGLTKGAWAIVLAFAGWAALQVYGDLKAGQGLAPPPLPVASSVLAPR